MKKKLLILLIIIISSCTTLRFPVEPIQDAYDDVKLDEIYILDIGQPLLTTGVLQYYSAIEIKSIEIERSQRRYFDIKLGDVLALLLEDKNREYYFALNDNERLKGISISKKGEVVQTFRMNNMSNYPLFGNVTNFSFEYTKTPNLDCRDCFKQEFVYNGKIGNNLKFLYREYKDSMIRASFNQEINYNLDDGNIVGFKGARIEVVETTNTSITYKVLKGFD
jgi:hypothetical protein